MTFPDLMKADVLEPGWRVSPRVRALVTTRNGGVSLPPFGRWHEGGKGIDGPGGLNLGKRSGDDLAAVEENRARLLRFADIVNVAWLQQVHGADVVRADDALARTRADGASTLADASVTATPGTVCVVMIADCMPVLLCDPDGRAVGAAHAGWRGLAGGVVEHTAQRVAELAHIDTSALHAYLGPSIGPRTFEVGADVRDAFMNAAASTEREATAQAFVEHPLSTGKYLADLPALARVRLQRLGIAQVTGGDRCTVTEREHFYSYRRDHETGRMAALIWLTE
ncbi:peptidoglycan editing factor PgeF [Paraburkholderia sp.]|uniref:peptidoglycan editing factor PgeF n=1 Tax=Paraburkholderia sp. TaxID=1926495 RepID=UPI003D6FADAA